MMNQIQFGQFPVFLQPAEAVGEAPGALRIEKKRSRESPLLLDRFRERPLHQFQTILLSALLHGRTE